MGPLRRRVAIALVLCLVALGAAQAGKNNPITDAGYVELEDSPCFPCHITWDPPLRDMASITPPLDVSAAVGEEFDYTVRFTNTWIAELVHFEPSLDLSSAPSLQFVGGLPDILETKAGTIASDPATLPISTRTGFVPVAVEPGVTDLEVVLAPTNTDPSLGPELTMNVYAGKDAPAGRPDRIIAAPGPGQPMRMHIQGGAEISELGFGNWSIEAETTPVSASSVQPGALGDIGFTVIVHKYFNASEERIQFLSRDLGIGSGLELDQSAAFTWTLLAAAEPGAGEEVIVGLNLGSYYHHDDGTSEDNGYTHHELVVPVASSGGGVSFGTDVIIVEPGASVGVSMSRISEVVGYVSAFLVLASVYTGGMFGKATRRQLNKVFGYAKRRVAFHNFLSYAIIAAAVVHMLIFLLPGIEGNYHWTLGLIWGLLSVLSMAGLGVTGAIQVPMIRKWNYATWRWSHFGLAVAVMVFTVVHVFLDGGNWGDFQSSLGWENPFDPRT